MHDAIDRKLILFPDIEGNFSGDLSAGSKV